MKKKKKKRKRRKANKQLKNVAYLWSVRKKLPGNRSEDM